MTLREGLRFHDGEPVRARDAVASLKRWGARDSFGLAVMAAVDELSAPSDRTVRWRLMRPFPLLPDALGKVGANVAFVMPERLAGTDSAAPLGEMVGSGPFRFAAEERVPGSRAVYARFEGYVPRSDGAGAGLLAGRLQVFIGGHAQSRVPFLPVHGTLADRLGRRRPRVLGTALYTLASAGCALALNMPALSASRCAAAFGAAASAAIPRAVVRDLAEGLEAARLMSRLCW